MLTLSALSFLLSPPTILDGQEEDKDDEREIGVEETNITDVSNDITDVTTPTAPTANIDPGPSTSTATPTATPTPTPTPNSVQGAVAEAGRLLSSVPVDVFLDHVGGDIFY